MPAFVAFLTLLLPAPAADVGAAESAVDQEAWVIRIRPRRTTPPPRTGSATVAVRPHRLAAAQGEIGPDEPVPVPIDPTDDSGLGFDPGFDPFDEASPGDTPDDFPAPSFGPSRPDPPAFSDPPEPGSSAVEARPSAAFTREQYDAAYNAVRFNPAEYRANPSYRHEAAMEILFGQLRPTVVHGTVGGPPLNAPPVAGGPGAGFFGGGLFGGGFATGPAYPATYRPTVGLGPVPRFGNLPLPVGTAGPPPFVFDPVQGTLPTFIYRYRTPAVALP